MNLATAIIIQIAVFINRSPSAANPDRRLHRLLSVAASRPPSSLSLLSQSWLNASNGACHHRVDFPD
jgi:hypothetical protein